MKIREDVNEYGTPVSVHECTDCKNTFTVCPPADDDWGGCQAESCPSYDLKRDADRLFDADDPRICRETKH